MQIEPDWLGLPSELDAELRAVLGACEQFGSHRDLQAVFATAELSPWQKGLPEASSKGGRVVTTIAYLSDKRHSNGEAALALFLRRMAGLYDSGDSRHGSLVDLEGRVTAALGRPAAGGRPATDGVLHNLPPRNGDFTGRDHYLAEIEKALAGGSAVALTQSVLVAGLGGVGKTQLAAEYAHRHQDGYEVVWWVRSEGLETVSDLVKLASRLGLPEANAREREEAVDALRRHLASAGRYLLIFDNAETVAAVKPYWPDGGGHVLITTRDHTSRRGTRLLTIDTWPRAEAVAFLTKRLQREDPAYGALCDDLGHLPLALEQAAAYMDAAAIGASEYRQRLGERRLALFGGNPPEGYPATVATTWSIAFEGAEKTTGAAEMLYLCAFLAPDDIPVDILALWKPLQDDLFRDAAVIALRRYSLVEVADGKVSVHRLVQEVVRERLRASQRFDEFLAEAVTLIHDVYPNDPSRNHHLWPECERLLPHGLAVLFHYGTRSDIVPSKAAYVANEVALYLKQRADYAQARDLYMRALAIDEKALGPNHPNVAIHLSNLGSILRDLGELDAARTALERALKIGEKTLGPEHPSVAIRLSNLGSVLGGLGELNAARLALERALAIHEKALGPEHPNVATDLSNLGSVLGDLGELDAARTALERALAISEKALGPEHPTVAIRLSNLGYILRNLGELDAARTALERALAIDEKALGPEHPSVATDLNNLAYVLHAQGEDSEAIGMMERAQSIVERRLGGEHPNTKNSAATLARWRRETAD